MDVKVESTITLTINGQKFELTRAEAFLIYNQLGNVVGNGPTPPFGIRDYNWPVTMPNTIPCDQKPVGPWVNPKWGELYNHNKIKYGTNFDITCEAR